VDGNARVFLNQPLNAFMGTGALAMRISEFDGDHRRKTASPFRQKK